MTERRYFRSSKDGERGYLIERDGRQYIKLDRPNEELLRLYGNGAEWIPDFERRPLSKADVAQICLVADIELCRKIGLHQFTKKTWLDLSDAQRIAWMDEGPTKTPERKALWEAIQTIMEPLTR